MARTVINIREDLLKKAKKMTGMKKKVDIVNYALNQLVKQKELEGIIAFAGKVEWDGNLEEMRGNRFDSRR
ncbi:MAG: type II toxin-antitoxin system VapB family antitoxin [bacterium]|nr:type II toxin-antitoxin system VapB family antitoxin [bacterium]